VDDVFVGCVDCAPEMGADGAGAAWSTIVVFSQSRCGTNDFGANRARVGPWMDALEAAVEHRELASLSLVLSGDP
jgi:Protein of unknown function (DUF1499)